MENELKAAWFEAAIKGDLEKMIFLRAQGANVDWYGRVTALCPEFSEREREILDFIGAGLDRWTALMVAVAFGHLHIVQFLIEQGADMEAISLYNFRTAMGVATASANIEMVLFLLAHGVSPEPRVGSYLHDIIFQHSHVMFHDLEGPNPYEVIIDLLLDAGADVNCIDTRRSWARYLTGPTLASPLGQALYCEEYDIAYHLLERGADGSVALTNIAAFREADQPERERGG